MLLEGVRILELSIAWAGPLAGKMFADLGADVIKVELSTARGGQIPDALRPQPGEWQRGTLPQPLLRAAVFPDNDPGDHPWNRQGVWLKHNRNKRSLCADLKAPEGRELFLALARHTDVVLDNYSPHVMRSLGLGYDDLVKVKPDIITVSMSGYGQTGPFANRVSFGPILEAHSGLTSVTGDDDAPLKLGAAFPDAMGGITGALAIMSALIERDETGVGRHIDLSQLEAYCAMGGEAFLYESLAGPPTPVEWGALAFGTPHGCYECAGDEQWVALSVESEAQWAALRGLLADGGQALEGQLDSPAARAAAAGAIDAAISAWCSGRTRDEAFAQLQAAGVPAFPALSNGELMADAHLAQRRMFVEVEQIDAGRVTWPAFPVRMLDGSDPARYRTAPALGGDNEAVANELGGLSIERVRELEAMGVLADAPPAG